MFKKEFLIAGLGFAGSALALDLPGPVVDGNWLAQHANEVQIVDIRSDTYTFTSQPVYENDTKTGANVLVEPAGHIAGSVLVDPKTIRVTRKIGELSVKYMLPEKADFEATMQQAGVNKDKPLVIVSYGMNFADVNDAARLYWQLKYFGEKNMAILDGGLTAWMKDGHAVTSAPAPATKGNWVARGEVKALLAGSDDVANAVKDKQTQLVDARALPQYYGLSKRDYVYAYGHIPGARPFSPELMIRSEGGSAKFLTADTYKSLLSQSGIDPAGPAITYCNSGHLSAGAWFILSELLGNPKASLYDGSLHEWTLEKRPMESVAAR